MKLFGKIKGLFPVFVIAGAVVITVKLLTTQTPENIEIFKVNAEEDIKKEDYKEVIEEPQAQEEPQKDEPTKEDKPSPEEEIEKNEDDAQEEAGGEETESADDQKSKDSEDEKAKEQQQEPPAAKKLKLIDGNSVATIIGKLINPK